MNRRTQSNAIVRPAVGIMTWLILPIGRLWERMHIRYENRPDMIYWYSYDIDGIITSISTDVIYRYTSLYIVVGLTGRTLNCPSRTFWKKKKMELRHKKHSGKRQKHCQSTCIPLTTLALTNKWNCRPHSVLIRQPEPRYYTPSFEP